MNIDDLRLRIDEIDKDLMRLLELRFQVVKKIGDYKKEHHLPIFDAKREADVLSMRKKQLQNKDNWPHFEALFKQIMDISKKLEK